MRCWSGAEQTLAHLSDYISNIVGANGNAGDACLDLDVDGVHDLDPAQGPICIVIWPADGNQITLIDTDSVSCTVTQPSAGTNTAIALGSFSRAEAVRGDNNTAIATGGASGARAEAGDGNNNVANATNGAAAEAGDGNNNVANASNDAEAFAFEGDFNTAVADGLETLAEAIYGSNNTATASNRSWAIAGGDFSTNSNDNVACTNASGERATANGGGQIVDLC